MTKTWNDLEGWFDFHNLYQEISDRYQSGVFVEVGCWLGKSVAFLAEKSSPDIKIFAVDSWDGLDSSYMDETKKRYGANSIYEIFLQNINDCGFKSKITPIVGDSSFCANSFSDKSCDFIFIDADHSYDSVKKDILAWYPKLKDTGTMAGHDIFADDVKRAVADALEIHNRTYTVNNSCWIMS